MPTYLVTGANRGIGLAITAQLLARGDRIVAAARDPAAAEELAALLAKHPGQGTLLALDVADEQSIARGFDQAASAVQHLDGLVNNAGTSRAAGDNTDGDGGGQLGKLSQGALLEVFRVNAAGALLVAQAALPLLRRGSAARILNISSVLGSIAGTNDGGRYAYRMSKAALNMATRALANDLKSEGIAVRAVHPGWVKTRMGGSGAPVDVERSARGLLRVLDDTTAATTGTFVTYDGKPCPW